MILFLVIFLQTFVSAQMTNTEIETQVADYVIKNNLHQKMPPCAKLKNKALSKCIKDQIWMDLNSNDRGPTYKHKDVLYATVFKDKNSNASPVCSYELKVDPIKKTISTKQKDWNCYSANNENDASRDSVNP